MSQMGTPGPPFLPADLAVTPSELSLVPNPSLLIPAAPTFTGLTDRSPRISPESPSQRVPNRDFQALVSSCDFCPWPRHTSPQLWDPRPHVKWFVSAAKLGIPGTPVSLPYPSPSSMLRGSNKRPVSPVPPCCPAGETEAHMGIRQIIFFYLRFIYLCVWMFGHMYTCAPRMPEEGLRSPETVVTYICESPRDW